MHQDRSDRLREELAGAAASQARAPKLARALANGETARIISIGEIFLNPRAKRAARRRLSRRRLGAIIKHNGNYFPRRVSRRVSLRPWELKLARSATGGAGGGTRGIAVCMIADSQLFAFNELQFRLLRDRSDSDMPQRRATGISRLFYEANAAFNWTLNI